MKYYRLLRDLPDLKAGEIFWNYSGEYYTGEKSFYNYRCENNPEWFEQVWKCAKCNTFFTEWNMIECGYEANKDSEVYYCKDCTDEKSVKIEPMHEYKRDPLSYNFDEVINNRIKINEIIEYINDRDN